MMDFIKEDMDKGDESISNNHSEKGKYNFTSSLYLDEIRAHKSSEKAPEHHTQAHVSFGKA